LTVPPKKRKGKVSWKQAPPKTMKKQKAKTDVFDDDKMTRSRWSKLP
jgi:hypothetical protein